MKKRNVLLSVLAASALAATVFTLTGCGKSEDPGLEAYEFAKTLGYQGSYAEWDYMLMHADEDRREIEVAIEGDHLVWRFVGQFEWHDVYSVNDIMGPTYSTHRIRFDSNGGKPVPEQQVKGNQTIYEPKPTKEGYRFAGWLYNGEPWDFSKYPVEDMTLVATWDKLYTVKYLLDDNTPYVEQYYDINDPIILPDNPTKDGYRFDYWTMDDNKFTDTVFDYDIDIVLKAAWSKKYNVTFLDHAGHKISSGSYCMGDSVNLPEYTSKDSNGWLVEGEVQVGAFIFNFEKDITIQESIKAPEPSIQNKYTYDKLYERNFNDWNNLMHQDEMVNPYIRSDLVSLDYVTNDGKINKNATQYQMGAIKDIIDVSQNSVYRKKFNIDDASKTKDYIYKIFLRDDLKWNDGTKITADDFVYSMKEFLDPRMKYQKGRSFIKNSLDIINAKEFMLGDSNVWEIANDVYDKYTSGIEDKLIFNINSYQENKAIYDIDYIVESRFRGAVIASGENITAENFANALVNSFALPVSAHEVLSINGKSLKEIKSSSSMNAIFEEITSWYQATEVDILDFFIVNKTYKGIPFEQVGFAKGEGSNEIILALNNPVHLVDANRISDPSRKFSRRITVLNELPLVKKDVYEACKVTTASSCTTSYNTTANNSPSWGPYVITEVNDKQMVLEKNKYWYGYGLKENEGLYQTNRLVLHFGDNNDESNLFTNGTIDEMNKFDAIQYGNSSYQFKLEENNVTSLYIQSNYQALKSRQTPGRNKTILANDKFRKAISLSLDRDLFASKNVNGASACNGLFSSYYDFGIDGKSYVYKETDEYKKIMCELHGIDLSNSQSLDEDYKSIKYRDLSEAKILIEKALEEESKKIDGYKPNDIVDIELCLSFETEENIRYFQLLKQNLIEMVKGTSLEGKLELTYSNHMEKAANDFRAGYSDLYLGGWGGPKDDVPYFLLAYIDPDYTYTYGLDIEQNLSLKVNNKVVTMSIKNWYDSLNSNPNAPQKYGEGDIPDSERLKISVGLEKEVLKTYYTIPIITSSKNVILSGQVYYEDKQLDQIVDMNDVKYLKYHYNDEAWAEYLKNNTIDYTK